MQLRKVNSFNNPYWITKFEKSFTGVLIIITGTNKLFSRPVRLQDFGNVACRKYEGVLFKKPIEYLYRTGRLYEDRFTSFESSWGLSRKSRHYKLVVNIGIALTEMQIESSGITLEAGGNAFEAFDRSINMKYRIYSY